MGAPMVARLTAAGHDVRALGRTEESRAAVTALGATAVADLASAADGADVVVVCVFTDDQVNAVVPELIAAMPTGSVLVLHTTGSPDTAAALAESAAPRGVAVLDASFQMMILWSFAQHGAGSLPCFAGRYRQFRRSFPAGSFHV